MANHWAKKSNWQSVELSTTAEDVGRLVHRLVIGGYEERSAAKAVTGQWIVFAKTEKANLYPTLGSHGDDEQIYQCLRTCVPEFPELSAILRLGR